MAGAGAAAFDEQLDEMRRILGRVRKAGGTSARIWADAGPRPGGPEADPWAARRKAQASAGWPRVANWVDYGRWHPG